MKVDKGLEVSMVYFLGSLVYIISGVLDCYKEGCCYTTTSVTYNKVTMVTHTVIPQSLN